MDDQSSITGWYHSLLRGDRHAAQQLWDRFAHRLISLARARLRPDTRQGADEEDVVISAFDSFFRAAEQGRFPDLRDRDGLWQLLVTITVRKVSDEILYQNRKKRGSGGVLREADLPGHEVNLAEIMSSEPSPELAGEMTEQCQRLLTLLGDEDLRTLALLKMEGFTNHEIADRLGCARSTVQRRLNLIKAKWEAELVF